MADPSPSPAAAYDTDSDPELEVSLRIISPSRDLADLPILRGLSPSTTVREVRLMVERELVTRQRPTTGMRLIYRGRMFDADHKTLQDVIGNAALEQTELHTLHLVLRDSGSSSSSSAATSAPVANQLPLPASTHAAHGSSASASQPSAAGPSGHNSHPHANPNPSTHAFVHHQPQYASRPAGYLASDLAVARRHAEARRAAILDSLRAHPQPQPGAPHNSIPVAQLQQLLAAADAQSQGYHTQQHAPAYPASSVLRHRNAPPYPRAMPSMAQGSSSRARPSNEPDVYILDSPTGPRALLINASGTAFYSSPVPAGSRVPGPIYNTQDPSFQAAQWTANELIRQHNERYEHQQYNHIDLARQHVQHMELLRELQQQHLRDPRLYPAQYPHAAHRAAGGQPARQAPGQPHVDAIPNFHANMQRAPGVAVNNVGFLAAVWPQVWLVARLILFVWWFTTPTASWTRWATVMLLATAVLIVNTGMLDNIAHQLWVPLRGHLDGLLPLAHPPDEPEQADAAAPANQNAGEPGAVADRAGGPAPDPADVARRLVERRQVANGERLMNIARSLERFGILFLASLAPGIAERHVQLVEEQERRRQQRIREQEEAAAAAATAAAAAAAAEVEAAAAPTETTAPGEDKATATGSEKPAAAAGSVSAS